MLGIREKRSRKRGADDVDFYHPPPCECAHVDVRRLSVLVPWSKGDEDVEIKAKPPAEIRGYVQSLMWLKSGWRATVAYWSSAAEEVSESFKGNRRALLERYSAHGRGQSD